MSNYIKINGEWKEVLDIYKKVNGEWVLQTDIQSSILTSNIYLYSNVHDYSMDYLTFQILENGVIPWKANTTTKTIEYSLNSGAWTSITSTSSGVMINVSQGDTIRFRGNNATYCSGNKSQYSGFGLGEGDNNGDYVSNAASFNVEGNVMSLIYGDNFINQTSFPSGTYNLCSLFKKAKVISAKNLILPATTLTNYCYAYMFNGCTSLTTAPELPATTLANYCYSTMFNGCTSLTTAPELPATALKNECYRQMFASCTNLTTAPELPATALTNGCYRQMFASCTNLTTAPELPATTLVTMCYVSMFDSCASLTTAPELPATTLATQCYQSMFQRCTSLTTAPVLSATTLATQCYQYMFKGCSNLNSITCLATDIGARNCTQNWVSGVAASGTFTKAASMSNWTTGVSGIPTNWTVVNYTE